MNIKINDIVIGSRRRKLNKDKVSVLAESMKLIGQLEPLTITRDNVLLAGWHRLEAAKSLGWDEIKAEVFDGNEVECELAEIDENLMRNDLTVLEQGEHLARRQELIGRNVGRYPNTATVAELKTTPEIAKSNGEIISPLKTTEEIARDIGLTERSAQQRMQAARKIIPEVKEIIRDTEIADSTTQLLQLARLDPDKQLEVARNITNGVSSIADAVRQVKKAQVIASLENVEAQEAKKIEGVYDVIVIDPPWPMKKIERDVAPNQVEFDYPTMSEEELFNLEIPCADNCHVWLWTTQKYLPLALDLLEAWDLKYVCTFVWHKPGGFQPFGLPQYNCEFALYARRGSPEFIDFKNFMACFEAPRGAHSEKPQEFYDMVNRVTAGRRLDMFNRREIPGFDTWGKEAK